MYKRQEFPLQGRHPYEVSKSCADLIAQSFAHTFGLAIAVTRCSNLYGGGDLNWNRLIPGTIKSVLDGRQPVIRSDGSFRRDYLYVADAVRGYLMLAQHLTEPGVRGQPFNLGSGCAVSALEVVRTIVALSDTPEIEPVILNEVKNEILDEYLSPTKAEQAIGWRPQYTLAGGLKEYPDIAVDMKTGLSPEQLLSLIHILTILITMLIGTTPAEYGPVYMLSLIHI